jgi:hypothetical protein
VNETRRHLLVGVVFLAAGLVLGASVPALEWLGVAAAGVGIAYVSLGLVEAWDRWRAPGDPR